MEAAVAAAAGAAAVVVASAAVRGGVSSGEARHFNELGRLHGTRVDMAHALRTSLTRPSAHKYG